MDKAVVMLLAGFGIGALACRAGNTVTWDDQESYDAVVCLSLFWLPIMPLRCVHAYAGDGFKVQNVTIRWAGKLVIRAMLRYWLLGLVVAGGILAVIAVNDLDRFSYLLALGVLLALLGGIPYWYLNRDDPRHIAVRRVLGPHEFGSSDPATWQPELLEAWRDAEANFGSESYAAAAPALLAQRRYADAMWTARLSLILEDKDAGERLTDMVLENTEVRKGLAEIGDKGALWRAHFAPMPRRDFEMDEDELLPPAQPPLSAGDGIQDKSRRRDDLIQPP